MPNRFTLILQHNRMQLVWDFYHFVKTKPTMALYFDLTELKMTVPVVTAHLEIFHCTHYPVIPKPDLYFTFCST